ncbi:glycosyltransferase family 9 protein [Bdellovibrio sp. HCB209]|uniref:glycosyltransferase family 9 protein n=1 Tax=Bdellovibrio sp. HCB209 TaxID=3394354 RepID=UPI0039B402A0
MTAPAPEFKVQVPGMWIPSVRTSMAKELGVQKKILFSTSGGIGDQLCAEPTLRYALEKFKDVEVSLATLHPYFFTHLNFKQVFDLNSARPRFEDYLVLETLGSVNPLTQDFMINASTHCVDYASMSALRCQLPNSYKRIQFQASDPEDELTQFMLERDDLVVIHAGKHWPSRTFPAHWWNEVLATILKAGATPVLIGSDLNQAQGTVAVNTEGCIDLRNTMTLLQTASFLKHSRVLLTNDSGPLHIAATGDAWIGFIASSKHADFIYHWRKEGFAWRMQDLGLGGMWDVTNACPNEAKIPNVAEVTQQQLLKWLPSPEEFANWALHKLEN